MKIIYSITLAFILILHIGAQDTPDKKLEIGGYGQVDFNHTIDPNSYTNSKLDVHRFVTLLGYRFNERTTMLTEIEFEHVKEVYIEQAYLQYKINNSLNLRGGLILIPMGIINEYHESATFNGVERPLVDKYIVPTTWREIGIGITGNLIGPSLKYQAYLVNGFNGYNSEAKFSGKNGLRSGRQKGAESYLSSPNLSAKLDYYGISGLNLGLAGYFGNSQSTLYEGIERDDKTAIAIADSSVVGISMVGLDARYNNNGLQLKGQFYFNSLSNTATYNTFTGSDLGSAMLGWYVEAGYNILSLIGNFESELIPFVRLENYNTHKKVEGTLTANPGHNVNVVTAGFGWKVASGAMFKTDVELKKSELASKYAATINAGIAVFF